MEGYGSLWELVGASNGPTFSRIASSSGVVEGDSDVTVDEDMMILVVESGRKAVKGVMAVVALLARPKTVRRNIEVDPGGGIGRPGD